MGDTGWRIACGQVPCRDFNTPGDIVPALIQALVFKIGGVNWRGYLIHAALCNAAFALGVTLFLSRVGAPLVLALFAGVLEGWLFNTPKGIPYYDQYSYFFGFFALAAAVLGVLEGRRRFLAAVPPLAAATLLSKLTPGAYVLALLPAVLWLGSAPGERRRLALPLVLSSAATGLALLAALWVWRIPFGMAWESLVRLPLGMGGERVAWNTTAGTLHQFRWFLLHFQGYLAALPVAAWALWRTRKEEGPGRRARVLALIALCSPGIDVTAQLLSSQGNINYQAFAPIGIGCGLAAVPGIETSKEWRWGWAGLLLLVVARTAMLEAGSSWKIRERQVTLLGLRPRGTDMAAFPEIGRELAPMVWLEPSPGSTAEEFWEVVDFLRARDEPFYLQGANLLPYALCGRVSPFPAAWDHGGLAFPRIGDPRRAAFNARFCRNLKAAGVRWVAFEVHPEAHPDLAKRPAPIAFPFLEEWKTKATGPTVRIGTWRLIPVDPGLLP